MNAVRILVIVMGLLLQSGVVLAQRTVERYENGEKKYQGRMNDGVKVGKHIFWFKDGSKMREEKYNEQGILIQLKEWNEQGELIKDENPEEGFETMRSLQFTKIKWAEVSGGRGVAISKVKGELHLEPILGSDRLILHYATYLLDGTEIESSFRAKRPIGVELSKNQFIEGFQIGLKFFEQGDNGFIKIPAHLAYGREGTSNVPPNSTLIFQVIILKRTD